MSDLFAPQAAHSSQEWMSIVEYARAMNVSDMTVRRRIKSGKLKAMLRDGKYFIPADPSSVLRSTAPTPTPVQTPQHESVHYPQARFEPTPVHDAVAPTPAPAPAPAPAASVLPGHLATESKGPAFMDASELVRFCESVVQSLRSAEKRLESQFADKLTSVERQVAQLHAELRGAQEEKKRLCEEVEDLEVLVSMLDQSQSKLESP